VGVDLQTVISTVNRLLSIAQRRQLQRELATTPRRAQFTLTNIATGTSTTQDVSWSVPILGDYTVLTPPPVAAAAALGLLTAGLQAGSKTATGCTLVIANRTGNVVPTAAFDVLVYPL